MSLPNGGNEGSCSSGSTVPGVTSVLFVDRYEQYVEEAYVEYLKQHNRPDEVGKTARLPGTREIAMTH